MTQSSISGRTLRYKRMRAALGHLQAASPTTPVHVTGQRDECEGRW